MVPRLRAATGDDVTYQRTMTAAALSLALWATSGAIQAGQAPPAAEEEPPRPSGLTERVQVRLVEIPVIARDRHGRPITDLTLEEIQVRDRRRPMKVAYLEPNRPSTTAAEEPLPEVRLYVGVPGGWEGVNTSIQGEPRYFLIFVDVENDHPLRRDRAMEDMRRFVLEGLEPADRVAVMSYNGEIHLELPFTTEREAVAAAVMRAFGRPRRPQVDLNRRISDLVSKFEDCALSTQAFQRTADERCLRDVSFEYAEEVRPPTEDFLDALDGVIRYVSGLRGRKTILALSHGVATDPAAEILEAAKAIFGNTDQIAQLHLSILTGEGARLKMDRLLEHAIRQKVTLHFVDRMEPPSGDFSARRGEAFQPGARPFQAAYVAAQMDLEELATSTGGAFIPSMNVLLGMRQVLGLEAGSYTLGYYADEFLSREQLQRVTVSTTRRGVRISHRRGYYIEPLVGDALAGVIAFGKPTPISGERQGTFLPFQVVADPKRIGYQPVGDSAQTNFTLHVQVLTETGRRLADSYHFVNHAYPMELWRAENIEPLRMDGWVELPPGSFQISATLRNPATGWEGQLARSVRVTEEGTAMVSPLPEGLLPVATRPE
jgi:VWFA-related protein